MSDRLVHLQKTLCAMRWIALMTGRNDLAKAIERDMDYLEQTK